MFKSLVLTYKQLTTVYYVRQDVKNHFEKPLQTGMLTVAKIQEAEMRLSIIIRNNHFH